ncbi:MAG: 2-C-methyl-D-erythritol 2,4-cyclodiphosphate synthase, partial [Spirochaetae bacterium HGW-Spirochaetae-7]
MSARIGQGWDIHRLVPGKPLVLGGVVVPSELGELGHSDGDALCHAIV